ncbi:PKD domain-containing protein [Phytoactinopolyspora halophila]|nr:PKD domain-containing protein [Phytoactinopolyspora halophila]
MILNKVQATGPWPTVFELDLGEAAQLNTSNGTTVIKPIDIEYHTEPEYWVDGIHDNRIIAAAMVTVEVDGEPMVLCCRPGVLPVTVGGVRLMVETVGKWAHGFIQYRPLYHGYQDVCFSVIEAGLPWAPEDIMFPIANYRWRSSTYHNTWGSMVPFNCVYYQRGEDLGAIPDRLSVVAMRDGTVVKAPRPGVAQDYNPVTQDVGDGAQIRYSHMNIEYLRTDVVAGTELKRGEHIGLTGQTRIGARKLLYEPRLNVELYLDEIQVNPYPMLIESYFRTYPDEVLALAGNFGHVRTNGTYRLDASRSVARPGSEIVDYEWHLHDGSVVKGIYADVHYERPGYYAEELVVRTADGAEDWDAISVRVYAPTWSKKIARGWAYYSPSREIRPGTEVEFWTCLLDVNNVLIDFGDGSPEQPIGAFDSITHTYEEPGLYMVSVSGEGPKKEPAQVKMRLRVEP